MMDPLQHARAGFETVDADPAARAQAVHYLEQWLRDAAFAAYRPQVDWLIETQQWPGLLDRFYQILPFGTGGRRGAVGIGPNRMNLWTLGASVQGHCEYLRERFPAGGPLRVVIAYDVRQFEDQRKQYNPALPNPVLHLSSRQLAHHAAAVYAANGIHAHVPAESSPRFLATPELSLDIRLLQAHGGLNISASHNPPDDNGGKFYDERGGQPVPPDDQIMADLVDQVDAIKELPWTEAVRSGKVHFLDDALHKSYIELCRKQSLTQPPRFDEFQLVFTPLHGVGAMTAMEILEQQGFRVRPVPEQMTPDGRFPNVTGTPNPEIPAALDRAQKVAEELKADLALATDPDADRLGALAPDASGAYRYLDGNSLAALLTHFKLARLAEQGRMPARPIVLTTLVTTERITRIARHFRAQVVNDLLVGFKYVADVLAQLEQQGRYGEIEGSPEDFVIAVEESHGILLMPQIRDKDAGAAALLMAELALEAKRAASDVWQYLDRIHRQLGYFKSEARTLVLPGVEGKRDMARLLERLRTTTPTTIGGLPVTSREDLQDENGRLGPFKGATDRAARNFLIFRVGELGRVALRPSGTEPKAKAYIEVGSPPCPPRLAADEWARRCRAVDEEARRLADEFLATCRGVLGV
jgi:phosphoglucomutase/phosphomannomutase